MQLFAYQNTMRSVERRREAAREAAREAVEALRANLTAQHEAQRRFIEAKVVKQVAFVGSIPLTKYQRIERRACKVFGVSRAELVGQRRTQQFVLARQFVAYWASRLTQHSLPMIGRLLGGRDHTTIIHGKRAYIEKRAKMGRALRSL